MSEIKEKGLCVCGRELDSAAIKHIDNVLKTMPPDSLTYLFGQFVSSSKDNIRNARGDAEKYNKIIETIANLHKKIAELEIDKKAKMDEIKKLDEAKQYLNRLEELSRIIVEQDKTINKCNGELRLKKEIYDRSKSMLDTMLKNDKVSNLYKGKLQFLNVVKAELLNEKESYEKQIKITLNECVRAIFKALTTQTALNPNEIQFIKEDFSLRTTFLTGGQLAVEVYAYIIGITKALQLLNVEANENPIVIDAPFAFTDNIQSEHIVETLPKIVKQTVLLTLDISKIIRHLEKNSDKYEIYLIETDDSQIKSTINRRSLEDVKKEMINK